jgi:hypothetical protein
VNRLYREFLRVHWEIKPKITINQKRNIINFISTSFVEQVFGQNLSKPFIVSSPSVGSFSINCTIQ